MFVHVDGSPSPPASLSLSKPHDIKGRKQLIDFFFIRWRRVLCFETFAVNRFSWIFSWHLLASHIFRDFIYFSSCFYILITHKQQFLTLESDSKGLNNPASSSSLPGFFSINFKLARTGLLNSSAETLFQCLDSSLKTNRPGRGLKPVCYLFHRYQ